ncbi:MAG TPA: creatininase family protein [Longilinea sp.]|nr:creatininase family protein [Longilinea sp.]
MRIDDCNWMDVENYLKKDDRLMLILGACEQHGYLSLMTDTRVPVALADAASQRSGVLVAPPLNFGVSPYFLAYPGTISLRSSTYLEVVSDVIRSVYGVGFRRLVILNGHGGNSMIRGRLVELANELPGLKTQWHSWWMEPNVTAAAAKHGLKSYHAAWLEAFRFTRVTELPQGEKKPVVDNGLSGAEATRKAIGDGVYGGPYQVDDDIMDEMFEIMVDDIVKLLEF